jgi:hypothetical protein
VWEPPSFGDFQGLWEGWNGFIVVPRFLLTSSGEASSRLTTARCASSIFSPRRAKLQAGAWARVLPRVARRGLSTRKVRESMMNELRDSVLYPVYSRTQNSFFAGCFDVTPNVTVKLVAFRA